jgi:hypothetical protein
LGLFFVEFAGLRLTSAQILAQRRGEAFLALPIPMVVFRSHLNHMASAPRARNPG